MLKTCSNHEFLWSREGEGVDLSLDWKISQELSRISLGSKIWCRRSEREPFCVLGFIWMCCSTFSRGGRRLYIVVVQIWPLECKWLCRAGHAGLGPDIRTLWSVHTRTQKNRLQGPDIWPKPGHLAKLGAPDIRPSAGHPAYTNNISVRFLDIYGRTSGPGAGHPAISHKSDALWIAVAGHPGKSPDVRPTQKLQPPQK